MPHFEICGWWQVDLRDERGRVLLAPAHRGHTMRPILWVAAVRAHVLRDGCLVPARSANDFPYLALVDELGEPLGHSPLLGDDGECERQLHILRNTVGAAPVVDVPESSASRTTPWARLRPGSRRRRTLEPALFSALARVEAEGIVAPPVAPDEEGRFRVHGGEYVALESEGGQLLLLTRKLAGDDACNDAIESLRESVERDDRLQRYATAYQGHAFAVSAGNSEPLAHSSVYASARGRDRGLEHVRRLCRSAKVVGA